MNNVKMYSVNDEAKSVVAKRFIKMLKNKIFKHTTAISKNVCFDVLGSIVNKSNSTKSETNWLYIWFLCWIQWRL